MKAKQKLTKAGLKRKRQCTAATELNGNLRRFAANYESHFLARRPELRRNDPVFSS